MADKLTTDQILALARQEGAFGGEGAAGTRPAEAAPPDDAAPAAETPQVESTTAEPAPAESAAPAAPTPKSTADILAAARGQGSQASADTPQPAANAPEPAKPAAGTPKSTADILAAARAQSGGSAAAAPTKSAAKPAKKASPKAPAAVRPAGDRPSVQDMIKAAREGRTETPAAEAEAEKPLTPPKQRKAVVSPKARAAAKEKPAEDERGETRRTMLAAFVMAPFVLLTKPFALAWGLFVAVNGIFGLALARFMMPNVLVEPPTLFKIGPPSDYPPGSVSTKWKAEFAVWIVHTNYGGQQMIYALSTVCTHLGCTPNWLEGEQKFKCPCHGSGFYANGINFEGPAPRPLERYGIQLAADGMLEVDKSVKFQEEMGQWADGTSFVPTA